MRIFAIQDIRVHGEGQRSFIRLKPVVNQYMRKKVPGFVGNVQFENVEITGQQGDYLVQLEGADAEHDVHDVTFKNVRFLDSPLTEQSPHVQIGDHVKGVVFSHD